MGRLLGSARKKHDKYQQNNQLLNLKGTIFTFGTQIIGFLHLQTLVTKCNIGVPFVLETILQNKLNERGAKNAA
jgi:hypothetical protein